MRLLIRTKQELTYKGEAYQVVIPGRDGEFSVLDFHQPFLYRLRKGMIKVLEHRGDKGEKFFRLKDGVARFRENSLLILCEKE